MSTIATNTASRDRVITTLNHRQPGRVPIDFGGTMVTGVHASCVAELRDYYGLEKRPVRIHEPFQMLAVLDDDLQNAMGLDVVGVFARNTMFGFPAENWKSWMFNGLEVLVPEYFKTTVDVSGDTLIYPEGDTTVPPSGRMPSGGHFFDSIIRQEPLHEERLNPEDNTEEFKPVTQEDLDYLTRATQEAAATGRAVAATFGGTAFGDIAMVPAPFLKHPKGIRDIAEWYVSTSSRQEYIHKVFERQCEVAIQNLERIYAVVGDTVNVIFLCGTDFGTQTSAFCSVKTFNNLYYHTTSRFVTGFIRTRPGRSSNIPAARFQNSCLALSKPESTSSTRSSVPRLAWSRWN